MPHQFLNEDRFIRLRKILQFTYPMQKQSQFGDSDKTKIEVRICCHTGIQMISQDLNLSKTKETLSINCRVRIILCQIQSTNTAHAYTKKVRPVPTYLALCRENSLRIEPERLINTLFTVYVSLQYISGEQIIHISELL